MDAPWEGLAPKCSAACSVIAALALPDGVSSNDKLPALVSAAGCPLESWFPVILNNFAELVLVPVTKDGYPVLLIRFEEQSSFEFCSHLLRHADGVLKVGIY
jgi:hypothetical protein